MKRLILPVVLLAVLACTSRHTQVITAVPAAPGTIRGYVQDDSGSALPGVTVIVKGQGRTMAAVTDVNGLYMLSAVPPGVYDVRAELAGFGTWQRRVNVTGEGASLVSVLRLSSVSETITVTAEAPAVSTTFIAGSGRAAMRTAAVTMHAEPASTEIGRASCR